MVSDIEETGRIVETEFIAVPLYERVNFPGRGMYSLCTDPWSYMCGQVVFLHYLFITSARVRRVLEPRAGPADGLLGHTFARSTPGTTGVSSVSVGTRTMHTHTHARGV